MHHKETFLKYGSFVVGDGEGMMLVDGHPVGNPKRKV
jgi:hypothetical protein